MTNLKFYAINNCFWRDDIYLFASSLISSDKFYEKMADNFMLISHSAGHIKGCAYIKLFFIHNLAYQSPGQKYLCIHHLLPYTMFLPILKLDLYDLNN